MKRFLTLIALLTVFLGARAVEIVDAFVDYSTVTVIPRFSWGGSDSAFARLSLQDGCLHFHSEEATDPYWECQFFPIGGVDAEVGVTYTLHYKIKGDHNGNVSMLGFGQTPYGQFQITDDWVEGTVDYECTEANGNILMQCGDWVGDWDIAYLKITHKEAAYKERPLEWGEELVNNGDAEKTWAELGLADVKSDDMKNNYKVGAWEFKVDWRNNRAEFQPAKIETLPEGGHAFFVDASPLEGLSWKNLLFIESSKEFKVGYRYKVHFRCKANKDTSASTNWGGQYPAEWIASMNLNIPLGTEWQTYEYIIKCNTDRAQSIRLYNLNIDEDENFYFDDISIQELSCDEGFFVTGINTEAAAPEYDYANAQEMTWDETSKTFVGVIGETGNKNTWVNQLQMSTCRGYKEEFRACSFSLYGVAFNDPSIWTECKNDGGNSKINLPGTGVWKVSIDPTSMKMNFVMLVGTSSSEVSDIKGKPFLYDGIAYKIDDSGTAAIVVSRHDKYEGAISIPEKIVVGGKEFKVTSIGDYAFSDCGGLTSVTIPNSVTSIGSSAFSSCSGLTSIEIPNSVTSIGSYAFSGCSGLTSIEIPNSVTSIGSYAFSHCSGLTSIEIPNSVTSIGSSAFRGCSGLTSIEIPNSVTSIGEAAFYDCTSITSVTIPNSVTSIGDYAFRGCSGLTSIEIPNSVTSIGSYAFRGCSGLTSIEIPNSVTSIANSAFEDCGNIKTVNVSCTDESDFVNYVQREDIKSIFYGDPLLTKVHKIYIGGDKLTDIIIPNAVTSIGDYAFRGCSGLTSIEIPNSLTSIGRGAFYNCASLTSIEIPNAVTSMGDYTFYGCSGLTSIEIPNAVTSIGEAAFYNCTGFTSITIPNSVTSIGDHAFRGCSGLTSVTISNSVTSIGEAAFYNCTGFTSITIPNSVTSMGDYTFYGCSGLTSIEIPNAVTSIGRAAFYRCSGLTSVTIGNSVTSIGRSAFYDCTSLTSVTIPNSVTSIGDYAFRGCSGLTEIYSLNPTPPSLIGNNYTFWGIGENAKVYVPADAVDAYKAAYYWGEYFENSILPIVSITSISITPTTKKLNVGDKCVLSATVLPEGAATIKTVTWSSSDTNVATVDATTGEVTAVGEGSATITATAADGSGVTGTCEITVKAAQSGSGTVDVTPRPTSGNYMYVEKQTVKPGQAVQIPVELVVDEQYEEEIVGFQCNIKLPEGMEFVKNAKGNVVFTWNNDRIDGHTITSKIAADGSVKLLAASMNGSTFMETEGVMFYFSATVPEGMEGEQALQLYNVRVSDIDDNEIRCPDMTSVIDVKTYTLGDLNDDGEWSVVDVTMAIKAILDETYIEAGDMNEDGEMSVVDATTIIKYVLNEGPIEKASAPAAKRLKANAIADKPKFVVSPIYVEPGTNNMYLTVDMLNKQEYIGFQTEICLPEGFKFYTNSKGKPTVTLNTDRLETHTATSKLKDERTLRILVASMESDPILDNEGELLRVRVVADANVEAGNHTATLIDSRVSDDNDIEAKLDVTNGYLRVFGEEAISLVVPEGGYATLCLPYNATVPAGLKAYKATGMKNGMVVIEEQTSIAACTPMIIEGTAGTYNFSGDNSDADEFEYSVGSLKSSLVPAESKQGYVLQNLSEGLGFYKIADALTVPSFRCVLDGASVSAAPAFVPVGFDEEANAIEAIGNKPQTTDSVYTLDGKRVKTMEKGKIYIVGGVKMIVKQ